MARCVLRVRRLLLGLAGVVVAGGLSAAGAATPCNGSSPGEPAPLQSEAEASPIYALLKSKFGAPSACQAKATEDNKSIVLGFPQGGSLTFSASEAIEMSSQEAVLPANTIGRADAIKLLRSVDRSSVPPKGCGIAWSKLAASPATTQDAVAEGKSCNCRVHLKTENGNVTALGFSIAC